MIVGGLAVVTGGAGGLGRAIGRRLSADGLRTLLVDIDPNIEAYARDGSTRACVADVTSVDGRAAVVAAARQARAPLAAIVNNAGINRDARVERMASDQFQRVIDVDLLAPMHLTAALRDLLVDGSSIVNISSRSALGNFGQANYSTAKAGLLGFTRALALELAPHIRVNAVAPGLIATPMTAGMPDPVLEKLVARIPAGRIGTPKDVAELVAFLTSPAAGYMTGQVVVTCGGRSLAP
jgi:NAD(P)-dependent dehydrogenase (short-subunit alcohol dehydrogenase family)